MSTTIPAPLPARHLSERPDAGRHPRPRVHVSVAVTAVRGVNDHFIFGCLDSLFALTAELPFDLAVTVVDNSPGLGLAGRLRARYPSVEVLENSSRRGFAANHNAVLKRAQADYLLVANDDLVFIPGALERAVGYLEDPANARVGVAAFRLLNPDGSLQPSTYSFPGVFRVLVDLAGLRSHIPFGKWTSVVARVVGLGNGRSRFWDHDRTVAVDTFRGALYLVRMSAARAVGPMDEVSLIGGEETEWHRRFYDHGSSVMFLHDAEVIHLGSQTLECHPSLRGEYLKGQLNYFRKHRSGLAYLLLRAAAIPILCLRALGASLGGDATRRRLAVDLLRTALRWRAPA